jgi:hypothetical protein
VTDHTLFLRGYYKFFWGLSPERYVILKDNLKKKEYRGIIVGMSYVQRGINQERLKWATVCMAAPSQDLYFDYEMLKYILGQKTSSQVKFCIMEVAPYELWYDMSLSKETMVRSVYYYPQVKSMHHFCMQTEAIADYERDHTIYEQVLQDDLIDMEFEELRKKEHREDETDVNVWAQTNWDESTIKAEVEHVFDKPYEATFKENREILENMVADLIDREILPIIVTPPFPAVFKKYMDQSKRERTGEVLRSLSEKYAKLLVLDYLDDPDFDEYYFSDWSHLNYWGSNLLSDKLNLVIEKALAKGKGWNDG